MNILNIKNFVKNKLENEFSGHDYLHALRVLENARSIASYYDVNQNIIFASCLIHDLIDKKLDEANQVTITEIQTMLLNEDFSVNEIKTITNIIENISFSKGTTPESLEGKIVQDADRLDALGAIGIARTFAYGGKQGRLIYKLDTIDSDDSVSHFYQKLLNLHDLMNTDYAKKEANKRTKYMKEFLETLYKETGKNI